MSSGGDAVGEWSATELAEHIGAREPPAIEASRRLLAQAAQKFHAELGCRNEHTDRLILALKDGAEVVRLAHQPNLFPYDQIFGQTLYLVEVAKRLTERGRRVAPVVFLVDHDVAGSKRTRSVEVFDASQKGHVRKFDVCLDSVGEVTPTFLCPAPSADVRAKLASGLDAFAQAKGHSPSYMYAQTGVFRECACLADFNAFSWANTAINLWNCPLLFVRSSDLLLTLQDDWKRLASCLAQTFGRPESDFLWRVCRKCKRRIKAECCEVPLSDLVLPRVTLDDLTDYVVFAVSGGTTYASGREHLVESHRQAVKLGFTPPPESCWRLAVPLIDRRKGSKVTISSRASGLIDSGRSSFIEHLVDSSSILEMKAAIERAIGASN